MPRTRQSKAGELALESEPASLPPSVELVDVSTSKKTAAVEHPLKQEADTESAARSQKKMTKNEDVSKTSSRNDKHDKQETKLSSFERALDLDSAQEKLKMIKEEKQKIDEYVSYINIESRMRLEACIEDLKKGLDDKLSTLADSLQTMYRPETALQNKSVRPKRAPNARKEFVPRDSTLSIMLHYNDENYKTIFNIMVIVLLLWGISIAVDDILSPTGQGLPNFDLISWGLLKDLQPFLKHWAIMFLGSFLIIPLAHVSAASKSTFVFFLSVLAYICFQIGAFAFSTWVVMNPLQPFAMSLGMGFMAEQCRMSLKMHSYFREKVCWKRFNEKFACAPKSSSVILGFAIPEANYLFGECEKYSYFMWVPTLLFRENYPRTRRIRWNYAIWRLLEIVGIMYFSFLVLRRALPVFEVNITSPLTMQLYLKGTFASMAPAMAIMFFTHFMVLHACQNLGAELTRFADRKFYDDWWNSRTYTVFYRKWNGVVHDWIHCYLYTDLTELAGFPKIVALLSSFILSAIVHEYLICVAMGFFLPILGVLFTGPGLIFILLTKNKKHRSWNMFMWLTLSIGTAGLMVLYCREFYYRARGPALDPTTGMPWDQLGDDFFVPRTYRLQFPERFAK
jgi:sterol O-acyltransferase